MVFFNPGIELSQFVSGYRPAKKTIVFFRIWLASRSSSFSRSNRLMPSSTVSPGLSPFRGLPCSSRSLRCHKYKVFMDFPSFSPAARTPCCSHILSASRLNSAEYSLFPFAPSPWLYSCQECALLVYQSNFITLIVSEFTNANKLKLAFGQNSFLNYSPFLTVFL